MKSNATKNKESVDLEFKARALIRAQERAKKREIRFAIRARALGELAPCCQHMLHV